MARADVSVIERGIREIDRVLREGGGRRARLCEDVCHTAPHIARMLVGEDQRFFIPLSMLCGAVMLSAASVLSKIIVPGALFPVGVVTAIIGVPFFFWLILGWRRGHA